MGAPVLRMSYQLALAIPGLDDRSARLAGQPSFPSTRGQCVEGAARRRTGAETCPHVRCKYHLLGELARRPDEEAVEAMASRLDGEWSDSCALDIADELASRRRGMPAEEIAKILGVSRERVVQLGAEAMSRMRVQLEDEPDLGSVNPEAEELVLSAVRENPGIESPREIAKLVDVKHTEALKAIRNLMKEKRLSRTEGRFFAN